MMRPYLTTSDCARVLGVSTRYVRDEIRDGRLEAEVIPRPPARGRTRGHASIRVYPQAFSVYLRAFWPRVFHATPKHVNDLENVDA